jgi:OmcA/MtrC family decaheme c-type cytochrome
VYLTGPGLAFTIQGVSIDAKGVAKVRFQITDGAGTPLDRQGVYTEGPVSASFVLSWLDQAMGQPLQYTSYLTANNQAAADTGGAYAEVDPVQGVYDYTFGTPVTVTDGTKTHTVGVWATRDFDGQHFVANAVQDFLPSGGTVTVRRDVVETTGCNSCHNPLSAHGGDRREVRLCVLCHSPQTTDDHGTTLDFKVMVHKIHRGGDLASVANGTPYQLVGDGQKVYDYSNVGFPQPLQRCVACHTGKGQPDVWKTDPPSEQMCGTCHDGTWFGALPAPAGTTAHKGGPQTGQCSVCHPADNGLAGISLVHLTDIANPASPQLTLAITSVQGTAPGQTPVVTFTVQQNGAPLDIRANPLPSLAVTVAGPTVDYAGYWQETIQGGKGAAGTLAPTATAGTFTYTFAAPMPASATGTYAFGLEGYVTGPTGGELGALNPVFFAAVTDAAPVPRRKVVDIVQCNGCHYALGAHGGIRTEAQYCAFCHNPNKANDGRVARFEVPATTAPSVDFKVFVHKIHRGDKLTQQPYVLGAYPAPTTQSPAGTPTDFGTTAFPGAINVCPTCHAGATYLLPLAAGVQPSLSEVLTCNDPNPVATAYCNNRAVSQSIYTPPTSAVCTACHDAPYTVAHAVQMSQGGESCATCHGTGKPWDVQLVHAAAP